MTVGASKPTSANLGAPGEDDRHVARNMPRHRSAKIHADADGADGDRVRLVPKAIHEAAARLAGD